MMKTPNGIIRRRHGRVVLVVLAALGMLAAGNLALAQSIPAQVEGTLTLEDGSPLDGMKIVFEPDKSVARPARKMKVKKGKFRHRLFGGQYTVTLENDDEGEQYFLKSIKFLAKSPSGQIMDEFESGAHPETGLPQIRVSGNARVTIDLIAAPTSQKKALAQEFAIAEASDELKKVSAAFDANDMETVLTETESILADKPELGPALYARGVALHRTGRLQESVDVLAKALVHAEGQAGIHGVYGMALLDLAKQQAELGRPAAKENFSLAADQFAAELAESPGNLAVITNQVVALDRAERDEDSVVALENLLEIDPGNINAHFRLASVHRKLGNAEKALEILASVPSADKDAAKAIYNVCVNLYNDKDYATAIIALDKAIEIDPDFALAYNLKGFALVAQGKTTEAVEPLEKFVELAPDHAQAEQARQMIAAFKK